MSIDEIKAMMKNNSHGLFHLIEDKGWMGFEYLKNDGLDGTERIYLIRKFYNDHKPQKRIDKETGQYKLI
jgi:hypothetical protein